MDVLKNLKGLKFSEDDSGNIYVDESKSLIDAVESHTGERPSRKKAAEYAAERRRFFIFYEKLGDLKKEDEIKRVFEALSEMDW